MDDATQRFVIHQGTEPDPRARQVSGCVSSEGLQRRGGVRSPVGIVGARDAPKQLRVEGSSIRNRLNNQPLTLHQQQPPHWTPAPSLLRFSTPLYR